MSAAVAQSSSSSAQWAAKSEGAVDETGLDEEEDEEEEEEDGNGMNASVALRFLAAGGIAGAGTLRRFK